MKKKNILVALSAIMLLSASSTVFAQEISEEQQASSTVTYHVDSQYTVYIPEVIDGNSQYTFTAGLMNIAPDEVVNVTVNGLSDNCVNFTGTGTGGGSLSAQIYRTDSGDVITEGGQVASFLAGSMESAFGIEFRTSTEAVSAGDYTATVTFGVNLQKN